MNFKIDYYKKIQEHIIVIEDENEDLAEDTILDTIIKLIKIVINEHFCADQILSHFSISLEFSEGEKK